MYNKNKKWIYSIEFFIVISAVILVAAPVIIKFISEINTGIRQKDIYISHSFADLFGEDTAEALLKEFMEQNPNLRIITAEMLSDIIFFDESEYGTLVTSGALLPIKLNSEIDSEAEVSTSPHNATKFLAQGAVSGVLSTSPPAGEQYAIPLVSFMNLLFYNIDILKAAGFNRPPKTQDDFLVYSRIITAGNNEKLANVSGAAMGLCPSDKMALSREIFSWLFAGGGNFWSDDSGIPVINKRNMTVIIAFLGRLYREGVLAQGSFETTGEQRLEQFARGEIGMIVACTSNIPLLKEKMDDEFGVTMIPSSAAAEKYYINLNNYYAGISSECTNPDEAMKFLLFIAEQSRFLCEKLQAVPGMVSDVFIGNYIRNDPLNFKVWEIFVHPGTEIVYNFSRKLSFEKIDSEEFENIFREEIKIFFEGTRTAEATTAAIQKRWEAMSNEQLTINNEK